MTLPPAPTRVSYPDGAVEASARVLHLEHLGNGRMALVLDRTSVHPVDTAWPDQGADRAVLRVNGTALPVLDCVVGATDGSALRLGGDIPVAKGSDGWTFLVVHVVDGGAADDAGVAEGDEVLVEADAHYRRRLSVGHTACHLASLALNAAVAARWKKETRADALGNPDFDAAAIDVSLIGENRSTDTYRLGKSLRRKGFGVEGFADALPHLQDAINSTLQGWVRSGAPVRIERDGDRLTDRRYWVCALPEGPARIPCGGTHVASLADLGGLRVHLSLDDAAGTPVLTMETISSP